MKILENKEFHKISKQLLCLNVKRLAKTGYKIFSKSGERCSLKIASPKVHAALQILSLQKVIINALHSTVSCNVQNRNVTYYEHYSEADLFCRKITVNYRI